MANPSKNNSPRVSPAARDFATLNSDKVASATEPELALRMSGDMHAWLKNAATQSGRSISEVLKDYLEELRRQHEAQPGEEKGFSNVPSLNPLSEAQVEQYTRDGYLLVSGTIPEEIAAKAEAAIWSCAGFNPDLPPSSWEDAKGGICLYNSADLVNCFTPQCLAAAAQLAGDAPSTFSKLHRHPKTYCAPDFLAAQEAGEDVSKFFRWDGTYTINIYPTPGEWEAPTIASGGHLDHSLEEHHHKTFPPVFRVGALIYLNDIVRHGGGTFVWPGSHRELEVLARKNPERYEYRTALNATLPEIELGDPAELTLKRGDVLFLHHLCIHAGSKNASNRPRFALNMKW